MSLVAAGVAIGGVALLLVVALRRGGGTQPDALQPIRRGAPPVDPGVRVPHRRRRGGGEVLGGGRSPAGGHHAVGPARPRGAQTLVRPLRDLFAAIFFAFIGLSIDPCTIPPVLWIAVLLGVVTVVTKFATGWWAAGRMGSEPRARGVVGAALVRAGSSRSRSQGSPRLPRIEDDLGPVTVAYVIFTVVVGSVMTKVLARRVDRWDPGGRRGAPRVSLRDESDLPDRLQSRTRVACRGPHRRASRE